MFPGSHVTANQCRRLMLRATTYDTILLAYLTTLQLSQAFYRFFKIYSTALVPRRHDHTHPSTHIQTLGDIKMRLLVSLCLAITHVLPSTNDNTGAASGHRGLSVVSVPSPWKKVPALYDHTTTLCLPK